MRVFFLPRTSSAWLLAFAAGLPGGGTASGQPTAKAPASLEPLVGKAAAADWVVRGGSFTVAADAALGRPVLTVGAALLVVEGKALTGPVEVSALVRLRTDPAPAASADLYLGHTDARSPGLRFLVSTTRGAEFVQAQLFHQGAALHDAAALSRALDWDAEPSNGLVYYPRAYSLYDVRPGWPEDFRVRIEHDMAALPAVPAKWLRLRAELRAGEVRFWLDDRLVGWKSGPDVRAAGRTRLELSPGVQLAGLEVHPWQPPKGFLPLHLEGYAQGRSFLGGASVRPGSLSQGPTVLDGVPFQLDGANAEGNDHLDVSRSLYRQANLEGYFPSSEYRWVGSARRDPARIQVRVPNALYDTLYLLAACDDAPDRVPLVSAMFFRPGAGFAETFEARVPFATAAGTAEHPVPVTLTDGRRVNLWVVRIPLDPGRLSSFADLDVVEVELTKKVLQFRSYPDPFIYGWHQGGPPSAVHVYAATLGEAPAAFTLTPDRFGHVWTAPDVPAYTATVANRSSRPLRGRLLVRTRSHDGSETARQEQPVRVDPGASHPLHFQCPVKLNGYHDLEATLELEGVRPWTERRSFVRLAPDRRAPRWTEGKGALFGYWSYHGGHHTPKAARHVELMTAAGARTSIGWIDHPLVRKHWARVPCGAWEVSPQEWARQEPPDPKKCAEFQKAVALAYRRARAAVPEEFRPDHVYFFPEPHVSQRVTEGNVPSYWGAPDHALTTEEKESLRVYMNTARCAAEAVRREWPGLKVLIPWGDPLFCVPLLRAGFPRDLIDGSGLDNPGFERLPEMQLHQICLHRLYELRREYARAGIALPRLQYCEGIFVPTEVGAVSWREQMDLYNRWALLSMAYGVRRFYSGWFAFDCGNYYGSEHYGGCGIQRRIPYCDPKPAYAAYATMTDHLDGADFAGYLPTGSHTTFCLKFRGPRGPVCALWTVRGRRPVTLAVAGAAAEVTDAMNNSRNIPAKDGKVTVETDPSVLYVSGAEVTSAAAGEPDHADAHPTPGARQVADLGDGTWKYTSRRDRLYENGTFAVARYPGRFTAEVINDPAHGRVLRSTLGKQEAVHELMPWYNVLEPNKPVELPGAPAALGLWVKGASDWGRVVYVLRDARGERWTSIGTQDQYNCDDVHSWSAFNFDGWRYLRFELPGHAGGDSFRRHGTTWWRSDGGDGVVDLPLRLERILVEQRTHVLYVNDVRPAAAPSVCLGKLFAEHAEPSDATDEAVRVSRLRLPLPAGVPELPNPIARMRQEGAGAPTAITELRPPREHNDGTQVGVFFREVPGAKAYHVWVSAHADGRGAVDLTPGGARSGVRVAGLRPALRLYFWVVYQNAVGKTSKPSEPASVVLADTFTEK
jgi:hypothetical protein